MKFAIIGTNFVSDTFMLGATNCFEFELAVVCSRKLDNAKNFADKYNCPIYVSDYRDIIKHEIDAVYIATPNSLHFEQAAFFLTNKIPVLCEKPLSSNIAEVEELVRLSRENNTLLMEAIMPLSLPNYINLKNTLKEIGTVRRAFLNFGKYSSRYDNYRKGIIENSFKPELSNGSLMDIGIYSVHFALGLFGKPEKVTSSSLMLESGVDGLGSILLTYKDKEVVINHSKITDTLLQSDIQGEDGNILIDIVSIPSVIKLKKRKEELIDVSIPTEYPFMYYETQHFIECIQNNVTESPIVTYQHMLDVHTLMTEVRNQIGLKFPADNKKHN